MTPKQTQLYWREWARAKRVGRLDEADRHALHIQALGSVRSSKHFTNAEFDKVLGVFRAISQPDNLNGQLRQQAQPDTRLRAVIDHQVKCLALFLEFPRSYLERILESRFGCKSLDALPAEQLPALRITLAGRLSTLRAEHNVAATQPFPSPQVARAGGPLPTEHDMCAAARVPCFRKDCAQCRVGRAPRLPIPAPTPEAINLNSRYQELPA